MNCHAVAESTAWPCSTVKGSRGEEILVLAPPVTFWDGSIVPLYVMPLGDHAHITDDGGILQHLEASGFRLTQDTRRQVGLRRAIERTGASFSNELTVMCKLDQLRAGFNRALAALFAARYWEDENAGRETDSSLLIAEAEQYLTLLRPAASIRHDVPLRGISNRTLTFPLALDDELFDAVGVHPASTAAMTKKLFDVRSVREQKDVPITIVLDDRGDTERANQDISLLSQLAHIERLSVLRSRALSFATKH